MVGSVGGFQASSFNVVGSSVSRARREAAAEVGLLAARVVVAARRVLSEMSLDDSDRKALQAASDHLLDEAATLRYVEKRGRGASGPTRLAPTTLTAGVLREIEAANDSERHRSEIVSALARQLEEFKTSPRRETAEYLAHVFSRLAAKARAITGSSGDRVLGRLALT